MDFIFMQKFAIFIRPKGRIMLWCLMSVKVNGGGFRSDIHADCVFI